MRTAIIFLAVIMSTVAWDPPLRVEQPVDNSDVRSAAHFAVKELQGLSDSGVYESLSLVSIISASTSDGVFHDNTFLTLTLASPYFKSGLATENFEVMVMKHRKEGHTSIAIDEFPDMTPESVEKFWIDKVERQRDRREALFAELQAEADAEEQCKNEMGIECSPEALIIHYSGKTAKELVELIETKSKHDPRVLAAKEILADLWKQAPECEMEKQDTARLFAIMSDEAEEMGMRKAAERILRARVETLDNIMKPNRSK